MENLSLNIEPEKDYSSGEEDELNLIQTEAVELNTLDNLENDYLLVGIYGNGSAFLKAALYKDMRATSNSFKTKFMIRPHKDVSRAKKITAELYQFNYNNKTSLVLHTKENFSDQSYTNILDYFKSKNIKYSRVAVFDANHKSDLIISDKFDVLYSLKNTIQLKSNQLIKPQNFPAPNTIKGFAAYLITYHEVYDVPCVVYVCVTDLYEVCLESIRSFNGCAVTYPFFREKLNDDYFKTHQISSATIRSLFKEFNSFKNLVYS
jgi:hypothetical protein